jgi:hypothetical protein
MSSPAVHALRLIVLAGAIGLAALVFLTARDRRAMIRQRPVAPESTFAPEHSGGHGVAAARRERHAIDEYVGSEACVSCHAAIAKRYFQHPMYLTVREVPAVPPAAAYAAPFEFHPPGNRKYRVELRDGQVYHHEIMLGPQGEVLYDQVVPIAFSVGAGKMATAYVIDRVGLYQLSSIAWYTQRGEWDLHPDYKPHEHLGFRRRVLDACIHCHVGVSRPHEERLDQFHVPALVEQTIGCERCHGPGKRHVEARRASDEVGLPDPTIVNPGRLPPRQRDSVCFECHLEGRFRVVRYGHDFRDFRPGDALEDHWSVFVVPQTVHKDNTTMLVRHVEQMMSSACYRASEGRMGCTTCHDPHEVPPETQRVGYYRQRCMQCHAQRGCSLDEQARAAEQNSCIACHMPRLEIDAIAHASRTDHRLMRRPSPPTDDSPVPPHELAFFDQADRRMPAWERDRARGIVMAAAGVEMGPRAESVLREAERLLAGTLNVVPDDVLVMEALGSVFQTRGMDAEARQIWQQALEAAPNHERILSLLGRLCLRTGDHAAALGYLDRLAEINAWLPNTHYYRAQILARSGRYEEALAAIDRAIELFPSSLEMRRFLADLCQQAGLPERARREKELLAKMTAAAAGQPPAQENSAE